MDDMDKEVEPRHMVGVYTPEGVADSVEDNLAHQDNLVLHLRI